jgi:hypothetical protein
MAYKVQGKTVTSPVTVKVFIEDAAVDFVAKHTTMGKREARKEMARTICGYGSFHDPYYLTVHEGSFYLYSSDAFDHYGEGTDDDFVFGDFVYSVEVQ